MARVERNAGEMRDEISRVGVSKEGWSEVARSSTAWRTLRFKHSFWSLVTALHAGFGINPRLSVLHSPH